MSEHFEIFTLRHSTFPGRERNWDVTIAKRNALRAEFSRVLTPEQIIECGLDTMVNEEWGHGDMFEADVVRNEEGVIVRFNNIMRVRAEE